MELLKEIEQIQLEIHLKCIEKLNEIIMKSTRIKSKINERSDQLMNAIDFQKNILIQETDIIQKYLNLKIKNILKEVFSSFDKQDKKNVENFKIKLKKIYS